MSEFTEQLRRQRLADINRDPADHEELARRHGQVWDTQELGRDFDVLDFLAPYVVVRRRSDGDLGSLEFQHEPRLYFLFQPDELAPRD